MSLLPDLTNPAQLLGNVTLKRERVEVPEWGVAVWVWELTGEQLDAYRSSMWTQRGGKLRMDLTKMRANTARLLVHACRTADGSPIFDETTGPDRILQMGAAGIERLAAAARRMSGLDEDDEDDADVAAGKSVTAPTSSPNGTSPSLLAEPAVSSSVG
jgi:hypothetical protein